MNATPTASCALACVLTLWPAGLAPAAEAQDKSCCKRRTLARIDSASTRDDYGVVQEIFDNKHSARLVREARGCDPNFVPRERASRDKAVRLYEDAMALQPRATINAALARRIAQLYAHYADPKAGIRPQPGTSLAWWERCIAGTSPRQLIWAQAHMGLGCAAFACRDSQRAAAAFRAILRIDPDEMDLPDWQVWSDAGTEAGRAELKEARDCLRERAERIRAKAVDNLLYVLIRTDGAAAVKVMLDVAREHAGTPVADRAAQLAQKAVDSPTRSLVRYGGLPHALEEELPRLGEGGQGGEGGAAEATRPLETEHGVAEASVPPAAAVAPAPSARGRHVPWAALAALGAGVTIALTLVVRRAIVARRVR